MASDEMDTEHEQVTDVVEQMLLDLSIKLSLSETRERQATEMCTWLTAENQRLRDERTAGPVCPYRVANGSVVGPNLSVDCGMLLEPERQGDVQAGRAIILEAISDMLNAAFRSGRGDPRIVHGVGCRYHNSGCEGDCDCAVTPSTSARTP